MSLEFVDRIEEDLLSVRMLRERLAEAVKTIKHLEVAVAEAADKFWVGHFYVRDAGMKDCMLRKVDEMNAARTAARHVLGHDVS